MRFFLLCSAAALVSVHGAALAEPKPIHLTTTAEDISLFHLGSSDHRRYGKAVAVTIQEQVKVTDGSTYRSNSRHIIACDGSWSTDAISWNSAFLDSDEQSLQPPSPRGAPLGLGLFDGMDGLQAEVRPAVTRNVASWCAKASRKSADDAPIYTQDDGAGYMLMRTLAKRGKFTEAWVEHVATKMEPVLDVQGQPRKNDDGTARTKRVVDTNGTTSKRQLSADCAGQRLAVLSFVDYDNKGNAKDTVRPSRPEYDAPVPDSVGEALLDFMCRLH